MRRSRFVALLLALVSVVAAALPAQADNVTVSVLNPGGSRTLYVEDLLGNQLTALNFGTTRMQPFRVRVFDTSSLPTAGMDRTGFSVSATMTNLYASPVGDPNYDNKINSANLSLSYPLDAVNAVNVKAIVAPVFNLAQTFTGVLCTTLTALSASCTVAVSGLTGKLQEVTLAVDLSDLGSLPLVPLAGDIGAFTNPAYAGVAASAPQPPSPPAATSRALIRGQINTTTVVSKVQTALNALLSGMPLSDKVDTAALTAAVQTFLGEAVWGALPDADKNSIVSGLIATAVALTPSEIKAQLGTYFAYPQLNVAVPNGSSAGGYQGTLVVTALQA